MMRLLPTDHDERMARALLALDGLSVGDAFGERFFRPVKSVEELIEARVVPPAHWAWTDDTAMALSVVEVLNRWGCIQQDDLAATFARRYAADRNRGYGPTAQGVLETICNGVLWQRASAGAVAGLGSMGSGAAMRAVPLGAYFADDFDLAADQGRLSAEVTHAHPDGQAGAMAVSVAAAWAARAGAGREPRDGIRMLHNALDHCPDGPTRAGIARAMTIPEDLSVWSAVGWLGNGSKLTSADTVPFTLWCAAGHLESYSEAVWAAVSGLGDRDTTCAIVGGLVALSAGRASIPREWLTAREPLG